jgi:TonB-dependent receptor
LDMSDIASSIPKKPDLSSDCEPIATGSAPSRIRKSPARLMRVLTIFASGAIAAVSLVPRVLGLGVGPLPDAEEGTVGSSASAPLMQGQPPFDFRDYYLPRRSLVPFRPTEVWRPGIVPENTDPILTPQDNGPVAAVEGLAGESILTGEVFDAQSLNPLAGAIVEVTGTGMVTETDERGQYRFEGLQAGDYLVEASALNYSAQIVSVTTTATQPVNARLALSRKPVDSQSEEYLLEEESVVGEFQEDSLTSLSLGLQTEQTINSGISKEEFSQKGVSDAAGAVGKISGANVVGGKFAVVRGLSDRYVTTLFNGAAISSADPSRKAVQLDIFPTVALQGVDIAKTYDPSLPGDFGGGTIRIKSLSIPEERIAEFKYKMAWNSNLGDRMLAHPNRELGFWGNVDKPIPDGFMWNLNAAGEPTGFNVGGNRITPNPANRNPTQQQAQIDAAKAEQAKAEQALAGVKKLHASQSFMPKVVKPEEETSFSLVYGDKVKLENGGEVGFMASFQHETGDKVNEMGPENRLVSPSRSWEQESYSRYVDWSAYLSGGYKANENHAFNFTYFRKRSASDDITHGKGFEVDGSDVYGAFAKNDAVIQRYGASAIYKKEFYTIDPVIRDTEIMQIGGEHKTDFGTKLDWSLTNSTARESRPHTSTFQTGILDFADPRIQAEAANNPSFIYNPTLGQISTLEYQTFVNDGNGSQDSSRETQLTEENALEGSINLVQSIYFSDDHDKGPRLDLAVGGSKLTKEREQKGRVYLLKTASWERWVTRNIPAWWPTDGSIPPFAQGSPLAGDKMADGSPLPAGYNTLGEYLAKNPDALLDYFNGYGSENTGRVPGTGTGSTSANYVFPDAPYYINGSGLEVRNVDSELSLTALYASATFHADTWRLGGGIRWEQEVKSYEIAADPLTRLLPGDPSRLGKVETTAIMPSIAGSLDLLPDKAWMNVAYSQTVARPTFHEFLPIESISQDTGILRRGNPDLTESTIQNLDLSFDYVFSNSFNMRASFFTKEITDPIVVVQRVDLGQNSNTYVNGQSGTINGIELEGSWKGDGPFSLTANYAFIDSTLKYQVNQGISVTNLETRFPFQPQQIVNATLGWAPKDHPWSAYLTANFTDEYPTVLRSDPSGYDVWLLPQVTLDLVVSRKIDWGIFDGAVTFGVRNLLEGNREYEYRGGGVGGGGAFEGLTYTQESPGRTYSIEIKTEF